jgi:hypothetical protein
LPQILGLINQPVAQFYLVNEGLKGSEHKPAFPSLQSPPNDQNNQFAGNSPMWSSIDDLKLFLASALTSLLLYKFGKRRARNPY